MQALRLPAATGHRRTPQAGRSGGVGIDMGAPRPNASRASREPPRGMSAPRNTSADTGNHAIRTVDWAGNVKMLAGDAHDGAMPPDAT